jgi:methionyl aminopeptidase
MITLKTRDEIALMRESGRIVAEVLKLVGSMAKPGITTGELDIIAEEYIRSFTAYPAFKGYGGKKNQKPFPSSICTSIDYEVVHGIPGNRVLKEGEILSVDVGVKKDGYYADGARTYAIGVVSDEKNRLMKATEESLYKGIAASQKGNRVHDISSAVQTHIESNGFAVVRDLVGHGVGRMLHEEPAIPNFGKAGTGELLRDGMTLAIEPMVNAGHWRVKVASDGWTVYSLDGSPSAHYEHTVAILNGQTEILTQL